MIYVVDGGDAWSEYLRRMLATRRMSVTELARRSGIHRTTISEWIHKGVGAITIQSVYLIADALEDDRANALRAAGNLPSVDRDPEVDLILASNRSEQEKAAMIERLMQRREEERQRRIKDLEWMLGQGEAG